MTSLENNLERVAVIGAAGKMGSGITYLLLNAMAELALHSGHSFKLKAIDPNEVGLEGLRKYLKNQITRSAEKNINKLRTAFVGQPELVSNEEIIHAYTDRAMDSVVFTTDLDEAKGSHLIFEAALEDVKEKTKIYNRLKGEKAFFFTNTSSIPIELLSEKGDIKGRLIGFHFYNPPAVQRLIEIIAPASSNSEFKDKAELLAKRLNKTVVFSADLAGFIGNGYFIRELKMAFDLTRDLARQSGLEKAILQVNSLTKDFLLRPMGVFQLLDYVGLEVAKNIFNIMSVYLPDPALNDSFIDDWLSQGIKGGQHFDGTVKDGIFQYDGSNPKAIFNPIKKAYVPLTQDLNLGKPPLGLTWKGLQKDPQQKEKIASYFQALTKESSQGSKLALQYLKKAQEIEEGLVKTKVAANLNDVSMVLKNGFFHLYGPHEVNYAI